MPTGPYPVKLTLEKSAKRLVVDWSDGVRHAFPWVLLRAQCPSADEKKAREERNPLAVLTSIPSTDIVQLRMVGNYAVGITWSDGHNAGIYSWPLLRELAANPQVEQSSPPTA